MIEAKPSALEHTLFSILLSEGYEEGLAFLSGLTGALPKTKRSLGAECENEFCLPPALALAAINPWTERTREISGRGGLDRFLAHVVWQVPYYRKRMQPAVRGQLRLGDFPVVSKTAMIRDYSEFLADGYHEVSWKAFKPTSGSTGVPLIVWFDLAGFYDVNYFTYRRVADRWPGFVESLATGQTSAVQVTDDPGAWSGSTVLPPLKFTRFVRQVFGFEEMDGYRVVQRVRAIQPPLICGLASSLLAYAELENQFPEDRCSFPAGLFVSGEILYQDKRAWLESHYSSPLINAYTSSEGGLVAMDCSCGSGMHVADHVRVEILTDQGEIACEGEGELLITNLMNWAMPFVRYRTGDRAVVGGGDCECGFSGMTIATLYGRDVARFALPDRSVETTHLDSALTALRLKDFQVRQDASDVFTFSWVTGDQRISSEDAELAVGEIFRHHAGQVSVRFDRVPSLYKPGTKYRRYWVDRLKRGMSRQRESVPVGPMESRHEP